MKESLYHNKISYLIEQEKSVSYLFWICVILILLAWGFCMITIRLSIKTTALYNEETNNLEIIWNYEEIDKINQYEKMKIDGLETDFKIKNMSEIKVMEESRTNYQIIEIESPKKYRKNQVLHILLFDSKEKIIEKLKKIIVGG